MPSLPTTTCSCKPRELPPDAEADMPLPYSQLEVEAPLKAWASKASSASFLSEGEVHHPIGSQGDLINSIRFIVSDELVQLPSPLPRCQDLPQSCFGLPADRGMLVAVSHAWRNQAHPDPNGCKAKLLRRYLQRLQQQSSSTVHVFFDFLSVPQRPFQPSQPQRTDEQEESFRAALSCMHKVYMFSDRVVHLDVLQEPLASEGEEYVVRSELLAGVAFRQLGDWVQVADIARPSALVEKRASLQILASLQMDQAAMTLKQSMATMAHMMHVRTGAAAVGSVGLFDRVLEVGGVPVTCLEDVAELGSAGDRRRVKLMRLPYGRVNDIPSDERGWIFLERFITAVKCAMLGDGAVSQVVLSNSPALVAQIETCAARLRAAAQRDAEAKAGELVGENLKGVLREYLAELEGKRFSAASTDKLLLDGGLPCNPDRLVVQGIMEEFVQHLSDHWQEEAAKQLSRSRHVAKAVLQAAGDLFLSWKSFSPEHVNLIDAAGQQGPGPLFLLLVLPWSLASVLLLAPLPPPGASWRQQGAFGALLGLFVAAGSAMFPGVLLAVTKAEASRRATLGTSLWRVSCALLSVLLLFLAAALLDTWPVPYGILLIPLAVSLQLPWLWFIFPCEYRRNAAVRRQLRAGGLILFVLLGVYGGVFPALNIALASTTSVAIQALIIAAFVLLRFLFEKFASRASRSVGPEPMPNIFIIASIGHTMNLCIALGSGFHWAVFVELLAFDVVDSLYHLWSLKRRVVGSSHRRGIEYYIAGRLLLRNFITVLVRAAFAVHLGLVRWLRPEFSQLLCRLDDSGFKRLVTFLAIDIVCEALLAIMALVVLSKVSLRPARLLCGLVRIYSPVFFADLFTAYAWFWGLQHTHFGVDVTFKLLWLSESGTWRCGLTWAPLA